jgi:hypothetical protein
MSNQLTTALVLYSYLFLENQYKNYDDDDVALKMLYTNTEILGV